MFRMTVKLLRRVTFTPEKLCVRNLTCFTFHARVNGNDGFGAHVFDGLDVLQRMIASVSQHVLRLKILYELGQKRQIKTVPRSYYRFQWQAKLVNDDVELKAFEVTSACEAAFGFQVVEV